MGRGAVAGVLAICSLGLGACSSEAIGQPSTARTAFPTHRDLSGGPAALQRGTILQSGSCVVLEEPVQHLRWLVIWPAGYELREGTLFDGVGRPMARVGDVFDLGGGEYPDSAYSFLQTLLVTEPPESCRSANYWLATDVTRR
jgi:hypothetical protein